MERILVTGAAGRVGSRLVGALADRGYGITGLVLPGDPNLSRLDPYGSSVETLSGNLLDPDLCAHAVKNADGVIHTANLLGPLPGMTESDFFDGNVRGTFNLLQAAGERAESIRRFVHFSSSAVYPNDTHQQKADYHPIDENHPRRPPDVYALTKVLGDVIVDFAVRRRALDTVMVRPSGIRMDGLYDIFTARAVCGLLKTGQAHPDSELYVSSAANLWEKVEAVAEPGQFICPRGPGGRPWAYRPVFVDDVVHGAICALEAEGVGGEAFNIAAPELISYDDATKYLAEKTGRERVEIDLPVLWNFDMSIEKARKMIGYAPKHGMREMIDMGLEFERKRG